MVSPPGMHLFKLRRFSLHKVTWCLLLPCLSCGYVRVCFSSILEVAICAVVGKPILTSFTVVIVISLIAISVQFCRISIREPSRVSHRGVRLSFQCFMALNEGLSHCVTDCVSVDMNFFNEYLPSYLPRC